MPAVAYIYVLDRNAMRSFIHRMNWHDVQESTRFCKTPVSFFAVQRKRIALKLKVRLTLLMREKSFIRIKESFNTNETKDRQYSKISLITFKDYLQRTNYKTYGYGIKPYPYKWWQVWYLIEVPAFYIRLFLSKILRIKETRNTHIATLILASIFDGFIGWLIAKLLDKIF